MKAIDDLHSTVDKVSGAMAKESAKHGKPITCPGKGCCACCYEPVYASTLEVEHALEGLSQDQRKAITERVRLAIEKIKPTGLLDRDLPPVMDWLAQCVPCPFLALDSGTCTIYGHRPTACREHQAVRDPKLCSCNRLKQRYVDSIEGKGLIGRAILLAHLPSGQVVMDNFLCLLANKLLGDQIQSANRQEIELSSR